MTRATSLLTLTLTLTLAVSGCGVARSGGGGGNDSGTGTDNDAFVDPGNDAAVVPGDDASTGEDPLNAAPTCTSGRTWGLGNFGSQSMNPGVACIACHVTERRAPAFTAAGTVYPSGHEPDLCNGATGAITIQLTDATGFTATVSPNSAGNFFYQGGLTLPLTASVTYMGRTRSMLTPASSGDCNSCHTQNGDMSAPGRITLP